MFGAAALFAEIELATFLRPNRVALRSIVCGDKESRCQLSNGFRGHVGFFVSFDSNAPEHVHVQLKNPVRKFGLRPCLWSATTFFRRGN
jgi:hypothetical protein